MNELRQISRDNFSDPKMEVPDGGVVENPLHRSSFFRDMSIIFEEVRKNRELISGNSLKERLTSDTVVLGLGSAGVVALSAFVSFLFPRVNSPSEKSIHNAEVTVLVVFIVISMISIREWFMREIYPIKYNPAIREMLSDQTRNEITLRCEQPYDSTGAIGIRYASEMEILSDLAQKSSLVFEKPMDEGGINQILDSCNETGKPISTLILNLHGTPTHAKLSERCSLNPSAISKLHFDKLAENANIVLESCSVGAPIKNQLNVAECFQLFAGPTRRVYAPVEDLPVGDRYVRYNKETNSWSFHTTRSILPILGTLSDHPALPFCSRRWIDITAPEIDYEELRKKASILGINSDSR